MLIGVNISQPKQYVTNISSLKAKICREIIPINYVLGENENTWNWKNLDSNVIVYRSLNIKWIPVLTRPNTDAHWLSQIISADSSQLAEQEVWKTFIRTIITNYKDIIYGIELWGDPTGIDWRPYQSYERYVEFIQKSVQIIKEVNSDVKILSGEVNILPTIETLQTLFDHNLLSSGVDIVGLQAYHPEVSYDVANVEFNTNLTSIKNITDKPLIVEIGYPAPSKGVSYMSNIPALSLADQASAYVDVLIKAKDLGVEVTIISRLVDGCNVWEWKDWCGVLGSNKVSKPSLLEIRKFV